MVFQKGHPKYGKGMLGKHHSEKSKNSIRLSRMGKHHSEETIQRIKQKLRKYKISKDLLYEKYIIENKSVLEIAKELNISSTAIRDRLIEFKISIRNSSEAQKGHIAWNKGKKLSIKHRKNMSISHKGLIFTDEHKQNIGLANKGKMRSSEFKRIRSMITKERWQNKEFKEKQLNKIITSIHNTPNKPEKLLDSILQEKFPNEFKFVGDGSVIIEGFNPDFINCNGKKLIIELNGTHWHNLTKMIEKDKRKLETYSKYGYRTLTVWENELKDINQLIDKIKTFI